MKAITTEIESKIDELLPVLDRDIRYLEQTLSRLDELRSFVIKRDDASLGKLLQTIHAEEAGYKACESQRQSIRRDLAFAFGCDPKEVTLSAIEPVLSGERRACVAEKKAHLASLAVELKKQHLSTALLLSDCARFNNMLLKSVFNPDKTEIVCYSADGSAKQQTDMTFMNLRF